MAKKPADRFQTAAELAEVLTPFSSSKPATVTAPTVAQPVTAPVVTIDVTIPPPSVPPAVSRGGRTGGPRRFYSLAGGAAAFAVLLGVIVITITSKDGKKTTVKVPEGTPVEVDAPPGSKVSITQSRDTVAPTTPSTDWHGWPKDAPPPAIAPFDAAQAKAHQEAWAKHLGVPVEYTNSIGMKFRLIPPGEFAMGSTPQEITETLSALGSWQDAIRSEAPQHRVILTRPFYLSIHEVTQRQFAEICTTSPSHFSATGGGHDLVAGIDTSDHPVENIAVTDAEGFCSKLSEKEKLTSSQPSSKFSAVHTNYRLPTEAEWEFACRAGTVTRFWIGDDQDSLTRAAWMQANSGGRTHAVGELQSNPFGLFDTHGNVWEWVQDGWIPGYYEQFKSQPAIDPLNLATESVPRIARGGSQGITSSLVVRSGHRYKTDSFYRGKALGFRVAISIDAARQAPIATSSAHALTEPHRWPSRKRRID